MFSAYSKLGNQVFLFFFLFFFSSAKARSHDCGLLCFFGSFCVFKLKIIDADSVAVLDAHFLKPLKQAALAKLPVEVHARFIVVEVDVIEQLHDPRAGDLPEILMLLDPKLRRVACLGKRLDVFRLIVDHRRKLGQLPGDGAHEILRTGRRCG